MHGFLDSDLHERGQLTFCYPRGCKAEWVLNSTDGVKISVDESIQNGVVFLSHTQYKDLNHSKRYRKSAIALDDHHDSLLFWCALSDPCDLTLRDWSTARPTLIWLAKLVSVAVRSRFGNTVSSHPKTPELTGKCGMICIYVCKRMCIYEYDIPSSL